MTQNTYRDRDYRFGQVMLTLRTRIGLTQAGLADYLGVSRRTVGAWESGSKYPKSSYLRRFIELALQEQAFSSGRAEEEIRTLWHAAHQKVLLDEIWLDDLLSRSSHETAVDDNPPTRHQVSWDAALTVPSFYGRVWEQKMMCGWIVQDRCQVISVIGLGGIGKSALAVSAMYELADVFDVVIWRSLRDLPYCDALLNDLLQVLAPQTVFEEHVGTEERLAVLMTYLRNTRTLLVLDNLESVLKESDSGGSIRPGFEGFERFLQLSAESEHRSCVLLTTREKPAVLVPHEGKSAAVRNLRLTSLDAAACDALLTEHGVTGTASEMAQLIEAYTGNPMALKIVAQTIVDLFDGEVALFLDQGEIIYGGIRELLSEQFDRLSPLEQSILLWLAVLREPVTLHRIDAVLVRPVPRVHLLEAIESLYRRSLVERGQKAGTFTLQSVVLEYVTAWLIAKISQEIEKGTPDYLLKFGLELAQTHEFVRRTQEWLIIAPILQHLHSAYPHQAAVEQQLLARLEAMKFGDDDVQGYGPANIVALLRVLRGNLRGLDLSHLVLRDTYLRGVEMQDASLVGAKIINSAFTDTFDTVMGIAISNSGELWAASTRTGDVRMWDSNGLRLRLMWQAHIDLIWTMDFSPDDRLLATVGFDARVKLWDVESGALVRENTQDGISYGVAFSPDGSMVASTSGSKGFIRDVKTGRLLHVLEHPTLVVPVAWHPDGERVAIGDLDGTLHVWTLDPTLSHREIVAHQVHLSTLEFSPDGETLATSSWDGNVHLWDAASDTLRETLPRRFDRQNRLTWSPDGRLLAGADFDKNVWIWDTVEKLFRAPLVGHTDSVMCVTFTPDGKHLLSAADGTLRQWSVESGQCIRILQGNTITLFGIDWNPTGSQLVAGGSDATVTIFEISDGLPPKVLYGHRGLVLGVGWSPDGRWIATGSWDTELRLWDAKSGICEQVLHDPYDPNTVFWPLEWSPDSQYLASTRFLNAHGILVWNLEDVNLRSVRIFSALESAVIHHVAWSPRGRLLAGGSEEGIVIVWDVVTGQVVHEFKAHHNAVKGLAWNPSGTRLASCAQGSSSGEIVVQDIQDRDHIYTLYGHPEIAFSLAWGATEAVVISGGDDGSLRWWDISSGECFLSREAHVGMVQKVRKSPDGSRLASAGIDGATRVWDTENGAHLQTLQRERPYERLNITGIKGLTWAQKSTLVALGAVEDHPG